MKHALKRLGVLGPGQYRLLVEEIRKAQTRGAKLTEALEAARVELRALKGKADEAHKALRESRDEGARHARRAEKLAADGERVRADLEHKRADLERKYDHDRQKLVQADERRSATVENMQQRLIAAEQDLTIARESLMAVEVKLDILEGAANVLDVRTRTASRRSVTTGTGASV